MANEYDVYYYKNPERIKKCLNCEKEYCNDCGATFLKYDIFGELLSIAEIAKKFNIKKATLLRLRRETGRSIQSIVFDMVFR